MRPAAGSRAARAALSAVLVLLGITAGAAQEAARPQGLRVAVSLSRDTVLVGEPFRLGVAIRGAGTAPVAFPGRLELPPEVEQRGPADVRREPDRDAWRATYPLVAWEAGERPLPAVEVTVGGGARGLRGRVELPPVTVVSVLPGAAEELELRGARPFLERRAFPWPWLLGAAVVAGLVALGSWIAGRRRAARAAPTPAGAREDAATRALRRLAALRARWRAGEVPEPGLYDGIEEVLRAYAAEARGWAPGTPLRGLPDGDRELASALRRSALVRFARLAGHGEAADRALDACEAWLRREAPDRPAGGERAPRPVGGEAADRSAAGGSGEAGNGP